MNRPGLVGIIATARKLAGLIWQAVVTGLDYVAEGLKAYAARVLETKHKESPRAA